MGADVVPEPANVSCAYWLGGFVGISRRPRSSPSRRKYFANPKPSDNTNAWTRKYGARDSVEYLNTSKNWSRFRKLKTKPIANTTASAAANVRR